MRLPGAWFDVVLPGLPISQLLKFSPPIASALIILQVLFNDLRQIGIG